MADELGNRARATLHPTARTLLAQANGRLEAQDHAGALEAYMEAVKADSAAADLDSIRRYAAFRLAPPPPPPGFAREAVILPEQARAEAVPSQIAALCQFVAIHSGNVAARCDLVAILPAAEAEALAAELLQAQPSNPELSSELFYRAGVTAYSTARRAGFSTQQKRDLILRGLAALERAESLRADYFESLVYRNLLLREQAQLESDPSIQQTLIAEADAVRQRAIEIMRAERGTWPLADCSMRPGDDLFRAGSDVQAPEVRHRVELVIPEEARKARIAGIVIIEAVIDKQGRVSDAKVLKALPFGLGEAAVEAVKQWTFRPGTLHGQPVDVVFPLTVTIKPE